MPSDRRLNRSTAPNVCPCCGGWSLPGQYRCADCVFHLTNCHQRRDGLARLDASLADFAEVAGRAGRVKYGGRAA
jgi:hypothetical protein